jgi:hypothetical protein
MPTMTPRARRTSISAQPAQDVVPVPEVVPVPNGNTAHTRRPSFSYDPQSNVVPIPSPATSYPVIPRMVHEAAPAHMPASTSHAHALKSSLRRRTPQPDANPNVVPIPSPANLYTAVSQMVPDTTSAGSSRERRPSVSFDAQSNGSNSMPVSSPTTSHLRRSSFRQHLHNQPDANSNAVPISAPVPRTPYGVTPQMVAETNSMLATATTSRTRGSSLSHHTQGNPNVVRIPSPSMTHPVVPSHLNAHPTHSQPQTPTSTHTSRSRRPSFTSHQGTGYFPATTPTTPYTGTAAVVPLPSPPQPHQRPSFTHTRTHSRSSSGIPSPPTTFTKPSASPSGSHNVVPIPALPSPPRIQINPTLKTRGYLAAASLSLLFDVSSPTFNLRIMPASPTNLEPLHPRQLSEAAFWPPPATLVIHARGVPWPLELHDTDTDPNINATSDDYEDGEGRGPMSAHGLLAALYAKFAKPVPPSVLASLPIEMQRAATYAFQRRVASCASDPDPNMQAATAARGVRRHDLLGGATLFAGLREKQGAPPGEWEALFVHP